MVGVVIGGEDGCWSRGVVVVGGVAVSVVGVVLAVWL